MTYKFKLFKVMTQRVGGKSCSCSKDKEEALQLGK